MNRIKRIKRLPSYLWRHKILTAVVLVALLVLGFVFRPKATVTVPTQKVTRVTLTQTVSVSGSVNATAVNLSFPTGGTLTYLGIKKGDKVTQGQLLANIDPRTAQKNLQASLIAYSKQRNTFDQTLNNYGVSSPSDAINDALKRILQNNQNDLSNSVNSVELQNLALQQSYLYSPISGIVTRTDFNAPGQVATATTLITVTDPQTVVFDMDVDQADIGKIQSGQKVHIVFDAYPKDSIEQQITKIDFVSHTTTNGGNAFTVETPLPASSLTSYRVGMNANADIVVGEKAGVLTVPISALVDNQYVYIKGSKGYIKRKIVLGVQNDTDTEVVSGLSEGDTIVLDPTLAAQQASK